MIQTMSKYDFTDWFRTSDRRKDQFSYEALGALFDYLEEIEEDTGDLIEFDPVALCVEYTEYKDLAGVQADYNDIENMDDLENHTSVIRIPGSDGFIIADY